MVSLGGDHLVTLPLLQAHFEHYGQMALVHFDAHSDTWEYDADAPLHHGMMFLKAAREGLIDPARSVQIGMRTPNDTMGFNVFDMNAVLDLGVGGLVDAIRDARRSACRSTSPSTSTHSTRRSRPRRARRWSAG